MISAWAATDPSIVRTACSTFKNLVSIIDIDRNAANGAHRRPTCMTTGRPFQVSASFGGSGSAPAMTSPLSRNSPSRSSCQTAARKAHEYRLPLFDVSHSSTSRNTECGASAFSEGGCHCVGTDIAGRFVAGDRWPLVNQPDTDVGGREPFVPGGGSSTNRAATMDAISRSPSVTQPDSRAR